MLEVIIKSEIHTAAQLHNLLHFTESNSCCCAAMEMWVLSTQQHGYDIVWFLLNKMFLELWVEFFQCFSRPHRSVSALKWPIRAAELKETCSCSLPVCLGGEHMDCVVVRRLSLPLEMSLLCDSHMQFLQNVDEEEKGSNRLRWFPEDTTSRGNKVSDHRFVFARFPLVVKCNRLSSGPRQHNNNNNNTLVIWWKFSVTQKQMCTSVCADVSFPAAAAAASVSLYSSSWLMFEVLDCMKSSDESMHVPHGMNCVVQYKLVQVYKPRIWCTVSEDA